MAKKKGKRAHGEGMLRERLNKDGTPTGIWEARVTVGRDKSGKLITKSFYGKGQKAVKEKRDKYLTEIRTGTYTEPSRLTVKQFIGDWLKLFARPNKKPATYAKYESIYRTHIVPELGDIQLQKLSLAKLQDFYNKKAEQKSSSTVSIMHIVLNGALEYAVEEGLIKKNPAKKTIRPTVKYKEVKPMTEDEMNAFLNTAKDHRMFAAFFLDLSTGLRRGELCALRWKNVDLDKGIIKVRESLNRVQIEKGKTDLVFNKDLKNKNAVRDVPLFSDAVEVLKAHKEQQDIEKDLFGEAYDDQDLVFCTGYGKPFEPRNLLRTLKIILKKAGLRQDITIHNMRHAFATHLLKKSVGLKKIIDLLGHADERMVLRTYGHSDDKDLRSAVQELATVLKKPGQTD